ncbi:gamma-glutamyl-gamma-aminobutyrate hydrolase [Lentzea sp. NBRC 105346]|uniref:gamma-glutamyl-gamma-aminobutyrate hydrolase family protein n=1 Tax=Lentzea sp. NBRC 105346 TaxID=3032205 RepID=UPI0024A0D219|nr:type 1 glutamine amidotransferase [Lentzea sp. NBRC 105346]GLZ29279.1 gamma-glutamyl-gamma-aminobutyrate hydrolase [Lentzea sp. NBRC 105346]
MKRPLIAIPARISATASALRYRADVTARALARAVYAAGGEPLSVHVTEGDVAARLGFADGLLLPGGGDVMPSQYGGMPHLEVYDVDAEQDWFDLTAARWALREAVPLLAICRGAQVVNVALGGDLEIHMENPHRHVNIPVDIAPSLRPIIGASTVDVSCFHHQRIDRLGHGVTAAAHAPDGTVEAIQAATAGWFLGVQWHPEDTADSDPHQKSVFAAFVEAAGSSR